jgi:hypothetical protein
MQPITTEVLPSIPANAEKVVIIVEYGVTPEKPEVLNPYRVYLKHDRDSLSMASKRIGELFPTMDSSPAGPAWTHLRKLNKANTRAGGGGPIQFFGAASVSDVNICESAVRFLQFKVTLEGPVCTSQILAGLTICGEEPDQVPKHYAHSYRTKWDRTSDIEPRTGSDMLMLRASQTDLPCFTSVVQ